MVHVCGLVVRGLLRTAAEFDEQKKKRRATCVSCCVCVYDVTCQLQVYPSLNSILSSLLHRASSHRHHDFDRDDVNRALRNSISMTFQL